MVILIQYILHSWYFSLERARTTKPSFLHVCLSFHHLNITQTCFQDQPTRTQQVAPELDHLTVGTSIYQNPPKDVH